jgi:hypothetical protein
MNNFCGPLTFLVRQKPLPCRHLRWYLESQHLLIILRAANIPLHALNTAATILLTAYAQQQFCDSKRLSPIRRSHPSHPHAKRMAHATVTALFYFHPGHEDIATATTIRRYQPSALAQV